MTASLLTMLLGVWIFVSAFVLPHGATGWNSLLVGLAVVVVGLLEYAAPGRPGVRYVNSALAVWLFASAMFLPHVSGGTVLHDIFVALLLALISLVPPRWRTRGGHVDREATSGKA